MQGAESVGQLCDPQSRMSTRSSSRPVSRRHNAGLLSSSSSFSLPVGDQVDPRGVRGYPIDFTVKAAAPDWPPPLIVNFSEIFQLGLGCYERYLHEGDQCWLDAAVHAGRHGLEGQVSGGPFDGGWTHHRPFPHTFSMPTPWLSAMAQGEGASLLVRVYQETGEEVFAEAARRALRLLFVSTKERGVQASLGGRGFPEEYPTDPPSLVLNGAIFALWGLHDVGVALADTHATRAFSEGVDTLAAEIHRWDLGYWSRYDLFPHPVVNVASSFYHELHVNQLTALNRMAPRRELELAVERFRAYAASRPNRARAFGHKVLFRMAVPRSRRLARLLPWARPV